MNASVFRLLVFGLAVVSPGAPAQDAHVHGTAELQVTIEKSRLTVEFRSPLSNLAGFEHAPRTDAQRAALKKMTARLNQPDTLFKPARDASCTAGSARIESPLDKRAAPPKPAKPAPDTHGEEHAELTATYQFDCANIGKLQSLEVALFDAFPRTAAIQAAIIGPRGQSAARLSSQRRVIKF